MEVHIAAEEVVKRMNFLVSPCSIDGPVVERLRQERARQNQESERKKRKAMEDLDDEESAGSPVTFEKRIQGFALVRGTSKRIL